MTHQQQNPHGLNLISCNLVVATELCLPKTKY
jgi:hypothetical protein